MSRARDCRCSIPAFNCATRSRPSMRPDVPGPAAVLSSRRTAPPRTNCGPGSGAEGCKWLRHQPPQTARRGETREIQSRAHKCASPPVAGPHLSLYRRRDMSRPRRRHPLRPGSVRRRQFRASQVLEQHRQRSVEDLGRVPIRDRVSQQILHLSQLRVGPRGHRELDPVAVRRERRHGRAPGCRRHWIRRR